MLCPEEYRRDSNMRKDMRELKKNNKGFTLAELLIVVAIIAVLVAVSVPMFNNQLTSARKSTNQANYRAAQSAAVAAYLSGNNTESVTYKYDLKTGVASAYTETVSGAEVPIDQVNGKKEITTIYVTVTGSGTTIYVSPYEAET